MKSDQQWKQRQTKVEYKNDARDQVSGTEAPKKKNPLSELIGQTITIQSKSGIIFSGKMTLAEGGFVKLVNAEVIGQHARVSTPWVLVERTAIAHIHPGDATVSKIE